MTWTEPEHVGKISISILDILSREFHKQSKEKELDYELLIKLSGACGYQAQLYTGLQKSIDMSNRLQRIEKDIHHVSPEDLAMKNNPVIAAEKEQKKLNALR